MKPTSLFNIWSINIIGTNTNCWDALIQCLVFDSHYMYVQVFVTIECFSSVVLTITMYMYMFSCVHNFYHSNNRAVIYLSQILNVENDTAFDLLF
jgi:hypothetical protein